MNFKKDLNEMYMKYEWNVSTNNFVQ
jgi:hypothetical protein